jgi:exopolysaccharide biosynthesis predicted pyruvyltransferase EpsI
LRLLEAVTGHRPDYVCRFDNCDWDRLAALEGPILLHGGGNFGDIYERHQLFREEVLARFPDRKVILLPQTIHFNDPAGRDRAARAIAKHRDFVVCVRDEKSQEIARRFDCKVALTPDPAFWLDLKRIGEPRHEVLYLHRTDEEQPADALEPSEPGWVTADWLDEPEDLKRALRPRALADSLLAGRLSRHAMREKLYRRLAQARVRRGVRLLSSARRVVTDRLHAHILCTLMGVPHAVADNSYGKLSSFMDAWRTDRPGSPATRLRGPLQAAFAA